MRLRLVPETPEELWDVLAGILTTPAARSVAVGRGDLAGLQQIWNDWLHDGDSHGAEAFVAAPGAVLGLLGAGLLKPAPIRAAGLPDWAQVGAVDPDPEQLIAELLAAQPAIPADLAGWAETASWWGQVRGAIAASPTPPGNAETAWHTWERLDGRFRSWLRDTYGSSLLSTAPFAGLHQVAPRLARRVEEGAKILLVVIDGLGFAQWHPLRRAAGLTVLDATGSLAMIPTLTSVSRQAIFAGELPRDFAEHIRTTRAEERRWRRFWTDRGVADRDISYTKRLGDDADSIPAPHGRIAAVVVNAVDDILHGADVLGDRQVAVGVDLWARTGFLTNLVGVATRAGYETWITSDHGNLPTLPGRAPREGQTVEAGIRVRIYPNPHPAPRGRRARRDLGSARTSDRGRRLLPPVRPRSQRLPHRRQPRRPRRDLSGRGHRPRRTSNGMSPRQPDPNSPRPLDRAMSLPLLETVYRIASLDLSTEERSAQLTIALREHTTDADAKTRVKKMVSRIWINPPQPAVAMIRWAIDHPEHFPDRRLMHTRRARGHGSLRGKRPRPARTLLRSRSNPHRPRPPATARSPLGRDLHSPRGRRQDRHQPAPPRGG